tara:strand:+ start:3892 stop:4746 length:855 start_codon:yes stop_codon:yes gene_type:complete
MKILYLTKGDHVDYQDDCLFIGLRELFGADVIDYNKRAHNYSSYNEEAAKKLYGMGMSVTRVLPEIEIDRTDITSKIKSKYFDYVVYSSIWRCNDYIQKILEYYPKNKIIAVDGEDETHINVAFDLGIPYFKRELIYKHKRLFPISFAIPTSKVNFVKTKTRDTAICDPRDKSTYIYNNETDYYKGYQEARFAFTVKKAGWDCMRHYEILANGCIPHFIHLANCPELTMTSFPKQLCLEANSVLKTQNLETVYGMFVDRIETHFSNNNTTKSLAKQFINTINSL